MNIAEMVTDTLIKRMEKGIIPWVKPWQGGEAVNYITQKPYTGINRLLLSGGEYLTFKQIEQVKGKLKKNSKSSIVVFYKTYIKKEENEGETKETLHKVLRYYRVFSISDVEGIDSKQVIKERENYRIDNCQKIIDNYTSIQQIPVCNDTASARAYYSPKKDSVTLPLLSQFKNSKSYYSTAFHELVHSTGHKKRLDRFVPNSSFGSKNYSKEELTAEIGSSILCNYSGIDTNEIIDNASAYIQAWLKVLKNDKTMILYASAKAEKAVELILNKKII